MVKVTIVGRARDGLPLSQGLRYTNEENGYLSYYRQQAEFILQEISRGALAASKMTILVDHFCFNYLVEDGVVFIVLCDSSYPRKLAFHYLQDLQKEFDKFDKTLIDKTTGPYSIVKFGNSPESLLCYNSTLVLDGIITNFSRQYIDTRTQTNLSKLKANGKQDVDIVTEEISNLLERRRNSGKTFFLHTKKHEQSQNQIMQLFWSYFNTSVRTEAMERSQVTPQPASSIWCSPRLEVIALKWTPILIFVITSTALIWASFVLSDSFINSSW